MAHWPCLGVHRTKKRHEGEPKAAITPKYTNSLTTAALLLEDLFSFKVHQKNSTADITPANEVALTSEMMTSQIASPP